MRSLIFYLLILFAVGGLGFVAGENHAKKESGQYAEAPRQAEAIQGGITLERSDAPSAVVDRGSTLRAKETLVRAAEVELTPIKPGPITIDVFTTMEPDGSQRVSVVSDDATVTGGHDWTVRPMAPRNNPWGGVVVLRQGVNGEREIGAGLTYRRVRLQAVMLGFKKEIIFGAGIIF